LGEGVLTPPFPRVGGHLSFGGASAEELAERFGTPLYVYDADHIRARVRRFSEAFAGVEHLVAYSVKANGNLGVLRVLRDAGCGADITSGGELFRALQAGIDPSRIVFAGVGKSRREIQAALEAGILFFNVESLAELHRLDEIASSAGVCASFGIRVNPDVLAATPHAYTRTGHSETKFGVAWEETREAYLWAADREYLNPVAIDVHIGSQITDAAPYVAALDRVLELVDFLSADGISLEYVDIGGGFGISYDGAEDLEVPGLAGLVVPRVAAAGLGLVLEPGRSLVGDAGVLLTRVEYVKRSRKKVFVIVDGGMTELIRPSHYGGYHAIERTGPTRGDPAEVADVVGPICETGDFLALDREMEIPEAGEILAVRTVGAYGFAMASNYNGRPRAAEALLEDGEVRLVRRRETFEDLIRGEV
jgi:diaminopimelate decarboxylase